LPVRALRLTPFLIQYGRRDPSRWPRGTIYRQKLALSSPIGDGLSRTQSTEVFMFTKIRKQ
jgi:hypothetical protein